MSLRKKRPMDPIKCSGTGEVSAELRAHVERIQEICDTIPQPDPAELEKLLRSFRQQTHNLSSVEVLGAKPLAMGFFKQLVLSMCGPNPVAETLGNYPPGTDGKRAAALAMGFFAGVYMAELGMAQVILREPLK
jgi:hypothetical protein